MAKQKKINIEQILAEYKDDICTFEDKGAMDKLDRISSGSILLDEALGGGFPKGTLVEAWGKFQSGKSTLCLHVIKEAQQKFPDEKTAYIDTEHSLRFPYAEAIGVNTKEMVLAQPQTGEKAFDMIEKFSRSGIFSVIVLDSVASIVPEHSLKEGTVKPGELARLVGQRLNVIKDILDKTETLLLLANQERIISINPTVLGPPGGKSIQFYASIIIKLNIFQTVVSGTDKIGQITRLTITKNKFSGQPHRSCDVIINYPPKDGSNDLPRGISIYDEVLTLASEKKLIDSNGIWYTFKDEHKEQGRLNAIKYLYKNQKYFNELLKQIK